MTASRPGPHDATWSKLTRLLRLSVAAVRWRWALFLIVAGIPVILTAGARAAMPRTYEVTCLLLVGGGLDAPAGRLEHGATRTAAELILRDDHLREVVRRAGLLASWRQSRPALLRWKDWISDRVRGPVPDDAMIDVLRNTVRQRLAILTTENTIEMKLRWRDPAAGERLLEAALRGFLQQRYSLEVSWLADAIAVLETRAAAQREDIERRLAQLTQTATRPGSTSGDDDRSREPLSSELRAVIGSYTRLLARIESARIELDQARAGFELRYVVVRPVAAGPRPIGAATGRLLAVALLDGVILGGIAGAMLETRRAPRARREPDGRHGRQPHR